jgi:hypothetical protein
LNIQFNISLLIFLLERMVAFLFTFALRAGVGPHPNPLLEEREQHTKPDELIFF